jgi:HEAT repeats
VLVEQRETIWQMVLGPRALQDVGLAEFSAATGIQDPVAWAASELKTALLAGSADDVELTMMIGGVFGLDDRWVEPLIEVLEADWGHKHEDAAFDLGRLGNPKAVPALTRAAYWVPEYLEFDEARSLAVKAIHSLGIIPGPAALTALEELLQHEDHSLRSRVERVLAHRAMRQGPGR